MDDPVIASILAAVEASPNDVPLRLHLVELLIRADRGPEAISHAAEVLGKDPSNAQARTMMSLALGGQAPTSPALSLGAPSQGRSPGADPPAGTPADEAFDWASADQELGDLVAPMFVSQTTDEDAYPTEVERSSLRLADVGGMAQVKERLEISFLMPMANPELRKAYGKSLRGGLLLYGPPGCGKTYIARAAPGSWARRSSR